MQALQSATLQCFRISSQKEEKMHVTFSNGSVLAIGNFDGVHLGHQRILAELKSLSVSYHVPTVVFSFHPAPKAFLLQNKAPMRLMRLRAKYNILNSLGINFLCLCRFDKNLVSLSAEEFTKQILIEKLKVKHIVVGEDFRFGKNRHGDVETLMHLGKLYAFKVSVMPLLIMNGEKVSSSRIRVALEAGDTGTIQHLLGQHTG